MIVIFVMSRMHTHPNKKKCYFIIILICILFSLFLFGGLGWGGGVELS